MKYTFSKIVFMSLVLISTSINASPEEDRELFHDHFKKLFPDTEYSDYKNGVYSIDSSSREQWESIEDFPPYEINVENGEELFNTPFKNCLLYTSPSPRDATLSRMPSSA